MNIYKFSAIFCHAERNRRNSTHVFFITKNCVFIIIFLDTIRRTRIYREGEGAPMILLFFSAHWTLRCKYTVVRNASEINKTEGKNRTLRHRNYKFQLTRCKIHSWYPRFKCHYPSETRGVISLCRYANGKRQMLRLWDITHRENVAYQSQIHKYLSN